MPCQSLFSVTRIRFRVIIVCLELSGTNKFLLVCLFFQISLLKLFASFLRPVLHYEVFNVRLSLFATACLVYRMSRSLSTTFLTFFRKFFASLYRASGARLVVSRDSLFIIPNLLNLVNIFF
mgnify:CR=1 FL=1